MPSSTMWSVLIVLAALVAAWGNIQLIAARDRERAQLAGEKAITMLKTECTNNLALVTEMREAFGKGQLVSNKLQTTAWEIASSGGLLVQIDQGTLGKIAEVYYLVGSANTYQSRLIELTTGMSITLSNVGQLRQQQIAAMTNELTRLEPKLKELIALAK